MERINGITFFPFAQRGMLGKEETKQSFLMMKKCTGANTVVLVPAGVQKTPQSVEIAYDSVHTMGDEELKDFIGFAHAEGVRVFLKPTVNCLNGVWRAYIHFFDEEVPCEPKWSEWFQAYTKFQMHYADIAQETGCEMFIAGCEMVMTEHREAEWRKLIQNLRTRYHGMISYNTDKYQEDHVAWWDCVDVISSSGYYPIDDWEKQLDRIEKVVRSYKKPFFFAELGCMSTKGSELTPNDWELKGAVDFHVQAEWYERAFAAMRKRDWVQGSLIWSWDGTLYTKEEALRQRFYEIYRKPAQEVVRRFYLEAEAK